MTPSAPASASLPLHSPSKRSGPIIVALGGSDSSGVLRAARYFASGTATGMLAVSILEPLPQYLTREQTMVLSPDVDTQRAERGAASLALEVGDLEDPATPCRAELIVGEPAHEIAEVARNHHSPLIVMGIGRHRPLDRILGLETAVRTIRRATCPVLAVSANIQVPFRDVILATDFSPASIMGAEAIVPLLTTGAVVHLVHVWEPSSVHDARFRALDETYAASLREKFGRLLGTLALPLGIAVKEEVLEGRVAERLLDYANAHGTDVIVAGRQGLNFLSRLVVGSVTEALLRGSTCSVLVSPAPTFAELDHFRRLIAGTSASGKPEEWAIQLDAFTRRNRGRRTVVDVDDLALSARVLESGYPFQGVTFDPHDLRVELMLGDGKSAGPHVTRAIGNVQEVTIATDGRGRDTGLLINHAPGHTVLTFSPD